MKAIRRILTKFGLPTLSLLMVALPSFADFTNGSFEAGDFSGWNTYDAGGAVIFVDAGPRADSCDTSLPSDGITDGSYAAYLTMDDPNTVAIWQDVVVPQAGLLSMDITYGNAAGIFEWTGTLDHTGESNQHLRVDIMNPAAADLSTTPGDIYVTLLETDAQSALSLDRTTFQVDLSGWAGQTVRVRVAKTDNEGCFPAVIDNVKLTGEALPLPPPRAVPALGGAAWMLLILALGIVGAVYHRRM